MRTKSPSPAAIVDLQMEAYNARDIDAYCELFAADAVISKMKENLEVARGIDAIRSTYSKRFSDSPNLHYDIKRRIALGDFVIDHELVAGISDGLLEVVAIYEVRDSLIQSLRFIWP